MRPTVASSLPEMFRQSVEVLTRPSVATFERYERAGGLSQALVYVSVVAVLAGLIGLLGGFAGLLQGLVGTIVGFVAFTFLIYYIGRSMGGTGTLDEVAYTFSLFYVPISLVATILTIVLTITLIGILLVPLVALAALVAQVFFAYVAVKSSMNMNDNGRVWITLIVSAVATGIVNWIVRGILPG